MAVSSAYVAAAGTWWMDGVPAAPAGSDLCYSDTVEVASDCSFPGDKFSALL